MITVKTRRKIAIARLLCTGILGVRKLLGLSNQVTVKRGGIWWNLDLTEGIDFSIYLLGGFESNTIRLYTELVKPGYTVLDIGANIGSHTLPLASRVGKSGRVIAFEPTGYGIHKMRTNIELNRDLAPRILVNQMMLVAHEDDRLESEIYSSWPLFGKAEEIHKEHLGQLKDTGGAVAITLDRAIQNLQVTKIDLIKLDVDGNEYHVIAGGKNTLSHQKPPILMELAPYLFDPKSRQFENLIALFYELSYELYDIDTGKFLPLDADYLRNIIPVGGTRNVLLKQSKGH
jgi:FkbM family methyltransferase